MNETEFNALVRQMFPQAYQATLDGETRWYNDEGNRIASLADLNMILGSMNNNPSMGATFTPERQAQLLRNAAQGGFSNIGQLSQFMTPQELSAFNNWNSWVDQQNADMDLFTYAPLIGGAMVGAAGLGFGPLAGASLEAAPLAGAATGGGVTGAVGGELAAGGIGDAITLGGAAPQYGTAALGYSSPAITGLGAEFGTAALGATPGSLATTLGAAGAATGAASGLGTVANAANTAQTAGSALSRILGGTGTASDWTQVLGGVAGAGLGMAGSAAQGSAYRDVADKYLALSAPYRDLLAQTYQPGFSMANQADFQNALDIGAQAAARATSARVGNPVDNPGAYAEMQKYITGSLALPQLNTMRSQLGTFGQLGTNVAGASDTAAAGQTGGMYNALGYGIGQITQPDSLLSGNNGGALSRLLLNSAQFL